MTEKIKFNNPFDFGFRIMYNEYPETLHNALNVPGIFKKKVNTKVNLKNGTTGEMDTSYIIDPDNKTIHEQMIANGEHQSTRVGKEKIKMIGNYAIQQIRDENLLPFSYVASHINKEKHKQTHEITPTILIKPYFLDLGEKDNEKRLNKLKKIIKQQQNINTEQALNMGIIALFAPRNKAKEITKEVVKLYVEISKRLTKKMESTLYAVLYAMINAYFHEEKEYWRMINMLKDNTTIESTEKFVSLDIAENKIAELEKENASANDKISNLEVANASANDRIRDLENEIMYLRKQLNNSK